MPLSTKVVEFKLIPLSCPSTNLAPTRLSESEAETRPSDSEFAVFATAVFATDVDRGLSQSLKSVPSRWLYDDEGSRLFTEITKLDEYDLTRNETQILLEHAFDVAHQLGTGTWRVIELGAGEGTKTEILLRALLEAGLRAEYWPIDVSSASLDLLCKRMKERLPELECHPVIGDNLRGLDEIAESRNSARLLILDLGSSVGNRAPLQLKETLSAIRSRLRTGDYTLTGFDLVRDSRSLMAAYNDVKGVTRDFNLNLLTRMNRELGADFKIENFRHEATWNPAIRAMESWLVSLTDQDVFIKALGKSFQFRKWEPLQTETSLKFHESEIRLLAEENGYQNKAFYVNKEKTFSDALWRADEGGLLH